MEPSPHPSHRTSGWLQGAASPVYAAARWASGLTQRGEEQAHYLRVGGHGLPDAWVHGQVGEHTGQLDEHVLHLGRRPLCPGLLPSFPLSPLGMQIQFVECAE